MQVERELIRAPRSRQTIFERASSTVVGILLAPLARRDKLGEAVWTVTRASVGLAEALHPQLRLAFNSQHRPANREAIKSQSNAVT